MTKFIITFLLLVVLIFSLYQIYKLYNQKKVLDNNLAQINTQLITVDQENNKLKGDVDYFQRSENLVKEVKSRLNYAAPGEKMIIVVPSR